MDSGNKIQIALDLLRGGSTKLVGFVLNTDPWYKEGQHWVAAILRENENRLVLEYFDPVGHSAKQVYDELITMITKEELEVIEREINELESTPGGGAPTLQARYPKLYKQLIRRSPGAFGTAKFMIRTIRALHQREVSEKDAHQLVGAHLWRGMPEWGNFITALASKHGGDIKRDENGVPSTVVQANGATISCTAKETDDISPEESRKAGIHGFPMIVAYRSGAAPAVYDGDRTASSIMNFMNLHFI
ncbi:hypothetical protein M427DRAFT_43414 [Gonapodya prolifera JEL478]|uniref:Ubiquitin-like protease family profile domain-containing protein n=1 Tax=Gonapodya prolifera (strain JEL478) TaxID=1344416 RepID=A0A139AIE1_GONPJ|nr:hypothetical protein M427DRAFT_43414 [Gonapodya prolifera JEL478]|eukprot:KXS16576.1 hypothetical protein M427DRAFT_43414 [Gonapodya prolifera JEL478]